ncbi:MAG TPA: outer membrane protein assembly factor BamE [Steroidobacteraceae bacterium]
MSAIARSALVLTLLLGATLGTGGCVYRPNIQQGNLLKVEDVDQVTVGMTRSQVRYLLGTPMLSDPFDPQRWDYIYTLQRGRDPGVDRAHFIVRFDGDKVSRIEKADLPAGYTDPEARRKRLAAAAAASPPAASPPTPAEPPPPAPTDKP